MEKAGPNRFLLACHFECAVPLPAEKAPGRGSGAKETLTALQRPHRGPSRRESTIAALSSLWWEQVSRKCTLAALRQVPHGKQPRGTPRCVHPPPTKCQPPRRDSPSTESSGRRDLETRISGVQVRQASPGRESSGKAMEKAGPHPFSSPMPLWRGRASPGRKGSGKAMEKAGTHPFSSPMPL